ncbi:MAG: hypothetical protein IJ003_01775 [Candidatus Gastranaerophilales bacterium]|nr:hypothetical protein [Candidatus Gastranaerophilales bacterium]
MKFFIYVFAIFLFFQVFAAEFGEYRYSQYLGLQQQLQNQRARAVINQRRMQKIPTRNIQYPTRDNPYPNITRGYSRPINPRQRYSAGYYQRYYR